LEGSQLVGEINPASFTIWPFGKDFRAEEFIGSTYFGSREHPRHTSERDKQSVILFDIMRHIWSGIGNLHSSEDLPFTLQLDR
jgi:hypothetical protein